MNNIFACDKKAIGLIHKVYLSKLKNLKKYTACTKTKSEVSGGGKKPWKQKGTGNARAGSIRSPLWKGGGVIFGPKPRQVLKKINRKENKLATAFAFFLKKNVTKVIPNILLETLSTFKTSSLIKFIKSENISLKKKIVIVVAKPNKGILVASKNIKNVQVLHFNNLDLFSILQASQILIFEEAFNLFTEKYGIFRKDII